MFWDITDNNQDSIFDENLFILHFTEQNVLTNFCVYVCMWWLLSRLSYWVDLFSEFSVLKNFTNLSFHILTVWAPSDWSFRYQIFSQSFPCPAVLFCICSCIHLSLFSVLMRFLGTRSLWVSVFLNISWKRSIWHVFQVRCYFIINSNIHCFF